jgi:hypothetical protein
MPRDLLGLGMLDIIHCDIAMHLLIRESRVKNVVPGPRLGVEICFSSIGVGFGDTL